MKQLLFLLLFPCLAMAQYPANGNQKISLGEQTTADGLVFRGVASIDTVTATSKITRVNKQDTSAFILLDTVTNLLWHYKTGSNGWIQAGGSTFDTATLNLVSRFALKLNIADTTNIKYVNTYGTQTVNGLKTFTDTLRIEDAIKVGANNAYVYSAGTGNYYFTKDFKNQSGRYTIAIGDGVLSNATTLDNVRNGAHGTVAIGYNNLKNMVQSSTLNDGVWNTSIGYNNLSSATTANFNTAVGAESMKSLTTGFSNAGLGSSTLESLTTGKNNLAIGDAVLRFITTGDNNIGIGTNSGVFADVGGANTVTQLNNSVYIGSFIKSSARTGVTNEIVIGKDGIGQGSNSIMLGNSSVTNAYCYDNTFSTPSDFRDKTNIENLNTGLDLILNLRPVKFQWNMRDYGKVGYKDIGFIAQEALDVQNINNEADNIKLVNDENQNQLSMQSGNLIPILVKAMQEQTIIIKQLEDRIKKLEEK